MIVADAQFWYKWMFICSVGFVAQLLKDIPDPNLMGMALGGIFGAYYMSRLDN